MTRKMKAKNSFSMAVKMKNTKPGFGKDCVELDSRDIFKNNSLMKQIHSEEHKRLRIMQLENALSSYSIQKEHGQKFVPNTDNGAFP